MKAKVKWFNEEKNYGFLTSGGKDVFVHGSEVKDGLFEGDDVEFDVTQGKKGDKAVNVIKI